MDEASMSHPLVCEIPFRSIKMNVFTAAAFGVSKPFVMRRGKPESRTACSLVKDLLITSCYPADIPRIVLLSKTQYDQNFKTRLFMT